MANVTAVIYNNDGRILRTAFTSEAALAASPDQYKIVANPQNKMDWDVTHFVSNNVVQERASMDAFATLTGADNWLANGTDTLVYGGGLPSNTTVTIQCDNPLFEPVRANITDGTMSLTTTAKGKYVITLEAFPVKRKVIEVTAV